MKKITIRLDDEDLRGLRVIAALKDTTPSGLLRQSVKDILSAEEISLRDLRGQMPIISPKDRETKGQRDNFPQEAESIVRLSDTSDNFQDNPFVDI